MSNFSGSHQAGIGAGLVISKRKEIDGNKWSYGGVKKTLTPPLPNCFSLRPATVGSPTGAGSRKMGSNCGYSVQLVLILLYRHFHHAAPTYASWPPHLCFVSLSLVAFRTPIHAPCPCFRIFVRAKGIFLQRTFRRCCLIKCHFFLISFTIVLFFLKSCRNVWSLSNTFVILRRIN